MKNFPVLISFLLIIMIFNLRVDAQSCKPSGKIKGKKPPKGECNQKNDSECFSRRGAGDGGGPSECDNKYHSDDTQVVALSTGWFNNEKRCLKNVTIYGNGKSVNAMVVDECDSTMGCDSDHDYQPPCSNNIVDASKAVWKALGVPKKNWGELDIHWSDS
ncbi:kiwellin-1-like [Abeliophyllum distichum]|uniref:Kiwellin-1-like n=1 Tax=Abeliophyllum distichum TaxID=126358 RepID=A0ABD1P1D8_9LAMI